MNVGLDTSVVLRLLTGEPSELYDRAVDYLDELNQRGHVPVISDMVCAEVYFALQHHFKASKAQALAGLAKIFADGEVKSSGLATDILKMQGLASAKPGFVDRIIHATYLKGGGEMVTFEKDSSRLQSVRVL